MSLVGLFFRNKTTLFNVSVQWCYLDFPRIESPSGGAAASWITSFHCAHVFPIWSPIECGIFGSRRSLQRRVHFLPLCERSHQNGVVIDTAKSPGGARVPYLWRVSSPFSNTRLTELVGSYFSSFKGSSFLRITNIFVFVFYLLCVTIPPLHTKKNRAGPCNVLRSLALKRSHLSFRPSLALIELALFTPVFSGLLLAPLEEKVNNKGARVI